MNLMKNSLNIYMIIYTVMQHCSQSNNNNNINSNSDQECSPLNSEYLHKLFYISKDSKATQTK